MPRSLKTLIFIVIFILVIAGIYYYALPKGATSPQSAVTATSMANPTQKKLKYTSSTKTIALMASKTHYIEQGLNSASKKLYAVVDPNCIWCHKLFDALQPAIQKGGVQVRWIIIGAVRPSSAAKAKAILASPSPIAALRLNESTFNEQKEEGGIEPAYSVSKNVTAQFKTNMQFAQSIQMNVTPVILFYDQNRQFIRHDGGMPTAYIKTFLSHVGNQF